VLLKPVAPAHEHGVDLLGSHDRLRRRRQRHRIEDEGAGLGAAEAAVEGDELFKGAALLELGVVEAVDEDVGSVLKTIGAAEMVRRVGGKQRQRILALHPIIIQMAAASRAEDHGTVFA
jgi:hypothetical protein